MFNSKLFAPLLAIAALGLFSTGCTNTVRYITPMHWAYAGNGGTASQVAPAGATTPEGTLLYITYWEGSCSSGILGIGKGCSIGDSKIKRCNAQTDNSLVCVEEADATKAFAREKK